MKELNRMLGIEKKLLTVFHPQIDKQMKWMNQELEQYLWFFVDHRQKDWPEWLVSVEFAVNNKVHAATKVLPFIANYGRELKTEGDICCGNHQTQSPTATQVSKALSRQSSGKNHKRT